MNMTREPRPGVWTRAELRERTGFTDDQIDVFVAQVNDAAAAVAREAIILVTGDPGDDQLFTIKGNFLSALTNAGIDPLKGINDE